MCPVCDASLHPSDPFSDVRSDQTLQDLAYMIVPKLFQRECERRKEFCKKNKIEYRMPKFKTKQGYIPGTSMINTMEESSSEEEEEKEEDIIARELKDDAWIQCEREDCLKWRRVTSEIAEAYEDKPWFCEFNPDKQFNSCTIAEVNHLKYERMAEAAGLTYVYSNMEEGTLVLAKLTGFTSWPAVICNDPVENEFYETNDFGNPTKYHVEFLGSRHTQAWVESRSTVNYTGFPKDPIGKNGKKLPKALIDAYFEAEDLRNLSLKEKLAHCVLSNGLAEKIRKRKEAKSDRKSENSSKPKKRRKRTKRISSDEDDFDTDDTDEIIEKISFQDQPGEIEVSVCERLYGSELTGVKRKKRITSGKPNSLELSSSVHGQSFPGRKDWTLSHPMTGPKGDQTDDYPLATNIFRVTKFDFGWFIHADNPKNMSPMQIVNFQLRLFSIYTG